MSRNQRKSLLYYWSIRYVIILFVSMLTVAFLATYLIYKNVENNQNRGLKQIAYEIGWKVVEHGGKLPSSLNLEAWLDDLAVQNGLSDRPIMFILNQDGRIIEQFPQTPPQEAEQLEQRMAEIMSGEQQILTLKSYREQAPFLLAVHPIQDQASITGYVLYMTKKTDVIDGIISFQPLRLMGWLTLMLCGWAIIYMLTRRLVKPIEKAADAAKQVVAGNYDVQLNKEYKEKEIYELMYSFKEMADRLKELEALRTQLLAGVTHELKTPVTSISGLVQAVREHVVSGKEADEFLEVCLMECNRLQKMVDDLLDFNSFAAQAISVTRERCDVKLEIAGIIERWQYAQTGENFGLFIETEHDILDWQSMTDSTRLEQIIINLLNNARDALGKNGVIQVRLMSYCTGFCIEIEDNGRGIPEAEQDDVFEPFYRGVEKKTRIRGLGIGLPFSRLIARSLGGDLLLTESTPEGTTFTLIVPSI